MLTQGSVLLEQLALPWPPSANMYWRRNGHRYFITAKGIAYRQTVTILGRPWRDRFDGDKRLSVTVEAYPPDKRRRDVDNIFKCLLDSLQWAKVYVDDSQIDKLFVERKNVETGGRVIVSIEEV